MNLNFRTLKASEIECRIGQIKYDKSEKPTGLTLLLYKDARCDMTLLDETVGAMNWKRAPTRDNANCIVSIYDTDKHEWVSKEDTGTESNTEAEKGLASDSFKRSCVNWGIGRELYTAPFIWVSDRDCNIQNRKCNDKFSVAKIEYDENRRICSLAIRNERTGKICFEQYAGRTKPAKPAPEAAPAVDYSEARQRLDEIVLLLTNGKPEDMRSAYHYWTDSRFVKLSAIPDEEIPTVLAKAESLYRKRNGVDYNPND